MKRPILVITLGYIIGILWGAYLHISIIPIIFFYPIYIKILKKAKNPYFKFYIKKSIVITIIITSIISNTITLYQNYKYNNLYKNIKETNITATVVSRKMEKDYKNVYKIKLKKLNGSNKYKNTYLYLYVKKDVNLEYGNLINAKITYKEPSVQRNYKGFNYKEYLKTIKVYGTATLEKAPKIIKKNNINIISYKANKLNEKMQNNIKKLLPEETSNLLIGIILR